MRHPKKPPWYVTKLIRPATYQEVDQHGNAFEVFAICPCGHVAVIPGAYERAKADEDWRYERLAARLRCGRCRRRSPKIEVYRRPTA